MYDENDSLVPLKVKERTQQDLAKVEESTKLFLEAEQVFQNLEQTKDRYLQVLDTVNDREKSILKLESQVNKLYKESESKNEKNEQKRQFKGRIDAFDKEVKQIIEDLDSKEQYLNIIRDKEQQLVDELEAKYHYSSSSNIDEVGPTLASIAQSNVEDDERLNQVIRDIESYNRMQEDLDRDERNLTEHNKEVLELVQRGQDGRDDSVNELEAFAREQIDLYRQERANEQ